MKSLINACLLLGGLLWASGCGIIPQGTPDPDGARAKAVKLGLDTPQDDRVSASDDATDWKVIELEDPTALQLKIYWDSPNDLKASVVLASQFGEVKARIQHNNGQREEVAGPMVLDDGTWFLRIHVEEGASVYTLELVTDDQGGGGGPKPVF